ncbi:MAG: hypothetical protein B7Z81_08685, partial [Acidocella sp. 20-61-6]
LPWADQLAGPVVHASVVQLALQRVYVPSQSACVLVAFLQVVEIGEGRLLTKIYSTKRFERGSHVKVVLDPSQCFVMDV